MVPKLSTEKQGLHIPSSRATQLSQLGAAQLPDVARRVAGRVFTRHCWGRDIVCWSCVWGEAPHIVWQCASPFERVYVPASGRE
eukprot:2824898-Rhodomonas_salina.1